MPSTMRDDYVDEPLQTDTQTTRVKEISGTLRVIKTMILTEKTSKMKRE